MISFGGTSESTRSALVTKLVVPLGVDFLELSLVVTVVLFTWALVLAVIVGVQCFIRLLNSIDYLHVVNVVGC